MPTAGPSQRLRADYASTRKQEEGAWVASVEEGSPAWEAGIEAGMRVLTVNGVPLRDLIDWRWEADGEVAELELVLPDDDAVYAATLEREPGQDWGIDFSDVIFDGMRLCVNACLFCFMAMLPEDARPSLSLRDDDYRLSFLQGNFVTLTNVSDEEVQRIIDCRLEPMNVSLHAVSPEVRRSLIGARAARGMEVLERLLKAGIEVHGQIVLCAGINDGDELRRTLDWVEGWPSFTSLALVPMGYTRYSKRFSSSFSEDREASRAVVRLLEPYQQRARRERGITRFQLADEFYLDAQLPVPAAETYDGYPQFYDGIGMLRSFLDETELVARSRAKELAQAAAALAREGRHALLVCGEAAAGVMQDLCTRWAEVASEEDKRTGEGSDASIGEVSGLGSGSDASIGEVSGLGSGADESIGEVSGLGSGSDASIDGIVGAESDLAVNSGASWAPDGPTDGQADCHTDMDGTVNEDSVPDGPTRVWPIRNDYYGGDVNVTGLIVSVDLLAQLPRDLSDALVVLPEVMFNFDKVTLDGDTQEHILREIESRGGRHVVSVPSPDAILDALLQELAIPRRDS